jgi:hypothetical protein
VDDLIAETGDEASSSLVLSEANQVKLKEILSLCKRMFKTKSRMLIFYEKYSLSLIKISQPTSRLP